MLELWFCLACTTEGICPAVNYPSMYPKFRAVIFCSQLVLDAPFAVGLPEMSLQKVLVVSYIFA